MECVDFKHAKRHKFSHDWLENEKYKSWIKEVLNDNNSYFCIPCNKMFSHHEFLSMLNRKLLELTW